ncbi:MAG: cytochrome C oxidase subunit IV family protein [Gammaproteobacteria bacterium]|nr:cytochrome C oxidase subunit IV family protein [Gammaproteobacteria bacterium]MBU1653853.1 cytochrome C oxidase subunit IV family protein [Gammaproteobacteria bacterium]MBU1960420.1 cytochrome C oxidase subunit IV family protein [Gammaproteobacteria bacterium]
MKPGPAERIWLLLIGLTGAGAWLAETGQAGWPLTLVAAGLIAIKSRLVIDYYMEMIRADRRFRYVLFAFVTIVSLLVVLSHSWGDLLRRITTVY